MSRLSGSATASSALPVALSTDNASGTAFGRLRVANPASLFDSTLTYDLQPLLFEQITAESGAAVAHDATNRCATLTLAGTPAGGKAEMRTLEHFRYTAGRGQLAFVTFCFVETAANVTKYVGYSDGNNGVELQQVGSTVQLVLLSDSGNGDQTVAQSAWNLDKLDGTGPSAVTADWTKAQILMIDFQSLSVGRVRVALVIDGKPIYVHQFLHSNRIAVPYWQTPHLPVRAGLSCSDTASTTMRFVCASVASEGGETDAGGYAHSVEGTGTAGNGARAHILSVRPKATFNSIANRARFVLESVDVYVSGSNAVYWELVLGQAISGTTTFSDVNATYSSTEYNTAGTISSTPAIVIASGYVAASSQTKTATSRTIANRYPITLNAAGAARALGTLSLLGTGIGGTSAMRASLTWRELR